MSGAVAKFLAKKILKETAKNQFGKEVRAGEQTFCNRYIIAQC
jgi:hypothetical protein